MRTTVKSFDIDQRCLDELRVQLVEQMEELNKFRIEKKQLLENIEQLKEEKKKLLETIGQFESERDKYQEAFAIKDDARQIFNILKERADYLQAMLMLEEQVEQLKAEKEEVERVKSWIKKNSDFFMQQNSELIQENAQLEAQLQNRDKVSQDERKPHKCPACDNGHIFAYGYKLECNKCNQTKPHQCPNCCGTGKERIYDTPQGGYEMLTNNWFRDAAGVAWKNCNTCNGTGILRESK